MSFSFVTWPSVCPLLWRSVNPAWNDGSFPRYQLATLFSLSGKPLIIGEFYMVARENGSGNKNTHGT